MEMTFNDLIEAKVLLQSTDYVIIQIAEGVCTKTDEEIKEIKKLREEAREVIRSVKVE